MEAAGDSSDEDIEALLNEAVQVTLNKIVLKNIFPSLAYIDHRGLHINLVEGNHEVYRLLLQYRAGPTQ